MRRSVDRICPGLVMLVVGPASVFNSVLEDLIARGNPTRVDLRPSVRDHAQFSAEDVLPTRPEQFGLRSRAQQRLELWLRRCAKH